MLSTIIWRLRVGAFCASFTWDTCFNIGNFWKLCFQPPGADLAPPLILLDASQVLRELMSVHDSSLTSDESEDSRRAEKFDKSVAAYMDPLVEMCSKMTKLNSSSDPAKVSWERDIFLVNCLTHLQVRKVSLIWLCGLIRLIERSTTIHVYAQTRSRTRATDSGSSG